ncbi:hypothetical protein PVT67_14040 [Gallaecimonas kandeliae]|uniref:hypothetical protein n=1 Tax=Gallaecimonas kandeliae TaxID=3029055 RepID=UPI0026482E8C|nr:hypothetical protein [Gallaecimonas kandeliae]WKE64775.1 hypothetical protein PVT67_14040 [Gallaecimonas kandeliae]
MKQLIGKLTLIGAALAFTLPAAAIEIPQRLMATQQAGLAGDEAANQEAISALGKLVKADGSDALALALLGSSETAAARYQDQPWQKMQAAEKGMAHLDKSLALLKVKATPAEIFRVTTTAACTFIKVPKMFNRLDQGYGLIQGLIASPGFDRAPPQAKASAYLCAIEADIKAGRPAQAKAQIAALTSLAPQGRHMAQLKQLEDQLNQAKGE